MRLTGALSTSEAARRARGATPHERRRAIRWRAIAASCCGILAPSSPGATSCSMRRSARRSSACSGSTTSSWSSRRRGASLLQRWLNPPTPPRGVYLWGGVGRGKSFLMDAFYARGADPAQDARAFPCLHARRAPGAADAQARGGPARRRRRAPRPPPSPGVLRRVPRLRCRRRDDPRPAADGAVRPRRGVRHDLELSARRPLSERPAAAEPAADHRPAQAAGSTWSRSMAAPTTACASSSTSSATTRRCPTRSRRPWRRASSACARVRRRMRG